MKVYIRKANIEDAKAISQVGGQSFRDTFGWQFVGYEDDLDAYVATTYGVEKIRAGLSNDNNAFWLAFVGDKPVGFAKLKKRSGYKRDEAYSQLQKIYVLHEYLGSGAGKMLYDAIEKEWELLGSRFLWLLVEINNKRAIRFYEKKEFEKKDRSEFVIGSQTFEFELMEKSNALNS